MTDVLDDLRAADRFRDATPTPTGADRMDAAFARLLAEPEPRAARPAGRARFPRARWVAAVAGAACLAGVAAGLPGAGDGVSPLRLDHASAAQVLSALRQRAEATPAGDGRYGYVKMLSYVSHMRGATDGSKGHFVVVLPHVDEQWVDENGDGAWRARILDEPSFPTPEDRRAYGSGPAVPPGLQDTVEPLHGAEVLGLTAAEVRALPTDPVALEARLVAAPITVPDTKVVPAAAILLRSPLTPDPVRAALYDVLRRQPGASVVPDVVDPRGRHGVGVAFTSGAWDTLFAFDKETGALLGTRSIGKKELEGRTITDWSLILELGRRAEAPRATVSVRRGLAPSRGPRRASPASGGR